MKDSTWCYFCCTPPSAWLWCCWECLSAYTCFYWVAPFQTVLYGGRHTMRSCCHICNAYEVNVVFIWRHNLQWAILVLPCSTTFHKHCIFATLVLGLMIYKWPMFNFIIIACVLETVLTWRLFYHTKLLKFLLHPLVLPLYAKSSAFKNVSLCIYTTWLGTCYLNLIPIGSKCTVLGLYPSDYWEVQVLFLWDGPRSDNAAFPFHILLVMAEYLPAQAHFSEFTFWSP